ncbi:hypothetical protein B7486_16595 [cyanobacterium TDX16]|nr:hypothetical protein B7486_16595 [cyanobacterium TDX16]
MDWLSGWSVNQMAVVEPAYKAESGGDGFGPFAEIRYRIFEADTLAEAMAALYAGTPGFFNLYGDSSAILPKASIACERLTENGAWDGVVTYQVQSAQSVAPPDSAPEFSFDTSGESKHITQALSQTSYPDSVAPDFGNSIGVSRDGIEGVDIIVPGYKWTETHYLSNSFVTADYKRLLADFTGSVHGGDDVEANHRFRGFAPGEVLFLGAQGSRRGSGDWQLTFSFARLPNETDLQIGDLTVDEKLGWQYLWIRSRQTVIGDTEPVIGAAPSFVYVASVYPEKDFEQLGIGTQPI